MSSQAMAALRRLAAFGLPGRLAFPEFVGLLRELAPFETASMLWLGPDYRPVDAYLHQDSSPASVARYAQRWFNGDEGLYYPRQIEMQTNPAVGVIRVSDFTADFAETEIYDEIFRHAGHHWIAGLALNDGRRPIGNLGLGRPQHMADFSDAEIQRLKLARPYIVQALRRDEPAPDWPDDDTEDTTAFLVADLNGRIIHSSPGAWKLLQGVAGIAADVEFLADAGQSWARPLLAELSGRIGRALKGAPAAPARLDRLTPYGRFVARAYALGDGGSGAPEAIGVQIEKRLPVGVKMLRSPTFRALTRREQDVAQMLARGFSYPQIAERLGMGASTVVTHVRNLGQKLGAGGREEIVVALCA